MEHGTKDMIVPEDWTQKTVEALKKAGYQPVLREFPMGHQITEESFSEAVRFLLNRLNPK
jgi:predicted esterase